MEILELKTKLIEIKNSPDGLKNIFEISQKRINEPENTLIEITQSKKQREKKFKEK